MNQAEYEAQINACKAEIQRLQNRIQNLEAEKRLAACREAADRRRRIELDRVLKEFEGGREIVVVSGRCWWHEQGRLIRRASPHEMEAADALVRTGTLSSQTAERRVTA